MFKTIAAGVISSLAFFLISESRAESTLPVGVYSTAQAERTESRVPLRKRVDAVKKRLVQDRQKFHECSARLDAAKAKKRMHTWKQIHFLEDCMRGLSAANG
jgi:hypothetical protein